MELAEPKIGITKVSTDGMDELFGTGTLEGTELTEPSGTVETEATEIITTDEAAKRLGITTRAVLKRIASGSLKGFRDSTKKKAEWRVYWFGTTDRTDSDRHSGSDRSSESALGGSDSFRYLIEQNQKLMEQNQALVYRNGYLEAQLSEKDTQLKLLVDSQSAGWWSRFCSWCRRVQL